MTRLYFIFQTLLLVLSFVKSEAGRIYPHDCKDEGAGSAKDVEFYASDVAGHEPFTLVSSKRYIISMIYTPTSNAPPGRIDITANIYAWPLLNIRGHKIRTQSTPPFVTGRKQNVTMEFQMPTLTRMLGQDGISAEKVWVPPNAQIDLILHGVDGTRRNVLCRQGNVRLQK